jgi:hypothetical protein
LRDEEGDGESPGGPGALETALDKVGFFHISKMLVVWLTVVWRFRVFVDDISTALNAGGKAYSTYGVDRSAGAIVVVRPDGYVGIVAPVEDVGVLNTYFAGFMTQRTIHTSHL